VIYQSKTIARRLGALLTVAAVALLQGCAQKPPGCGDAETAQTIQRLLVEHTQELLPKVLGGSPVVKDDPSKIQDAYYAALKVVLTNVVSDGYNDQAKKNSCRANLSVSTASGEALSRDLVYTTQKTEDKSGGFVVEVLDVQPFVTGLTNDLTQYYISKRFVGEWKGDYKCEGIDGAVDGPQGPYSMPVTVVVDANFKAKLERTTKGGGIEILDGDAGYRMRLRGEGKNSPDDTWRTDFDGQVQGLSYEAKGQVMTPEGQVLRQCQLKLALPAS
jgi:hypothetical protein